MLADKTNTVLEAAQFMVMVSLLIKKRGKRKTRGLILWLFLPYIVRLTVASMTESSLSSNLLSCASKRLRTELFSISLFGKYVLVNRHIEHRNKLDKQLNTWILSPRFR